jgi:hypothetical protein
MNYHVGSVFTKNLAISGLYYKHIMMVNNNSRVIRMTLQVVVSPMIIIPMSLEAPMIVLLTTLEVSCMVLENIKSQASLTIVTYDCHNILQYRQTTDHFCIWWCFILIVIKPFSVSLLQLKHRRHDTQHNDIQHNDK